MKKFFSSYKNRLISLLLVLLILSATGLLSGIYNYVMYAPCKKKSIAYLDKAYDQSKNLFLTLTTAKASLAVIEGSTLNINAVAGVNIQSGDAVQPLYDIIHIAWKGSLISLTSIGIQKFFFEIFKLKLLNYLLLIGLVLLIPYLFKKTLATRICYRLSKIVLVLAFAVYCLFPVGILVVANISDYINKNYSQPAIEELKAETQTLQAISAAFLQGEAEDKSPKASKWSLKSLSDKIEKNFIGIKDTFQLLYGKIQKISGKVINLIVTIIVIMFVEIIILPIVFLILFWYLIRSFWEKSVFALSSK